MEKTKLGSVIEKAREKHRMSQVALGKAVGVSHTAIYYTETGETILADALIQRVAKVLRLDERRLLELAAMDRMNRGKLPLKHKSPRVRRLIFRLAFGRDPSPENLARIASLLDEEQEPVAA